MSVLVAVSPLQGEPYFDALSRIPGLTVWREEDDPPPEQVEAILAWRMKDGVVGRFPKLRMISAIGAGVDKIVSAADLPPSLAVTRIVDPNQGVEIAQYVVAQALRVTRDLPLYAQQQARAIQTRLQPQLGLGQVVSELAQGQAVLGQRLQHLGLPFSQPGHRLGLLLARHQPPVAEQAAGQGHDGEQQGGRTTLHDNAPCRKKPHLGAASWGSWKLLTSSRARGRQGKNGRGSGVY